GDALQTACGRGCIHGPSGPAWVAPCSCPAGRRGCHRSRSWPLWHAVATHAAFCALPQGLFYPCTCVAARFGYPRPAVACPRPAVACPRPAVAAVVAVAAVAAVVAVAAVAAVVAVAAVAAVVAVVAV